MSEPDPARAALDARVLEWMREPTDHDDDERFGALALELFAFQFGHCAAYRRFCEGLLDRRKQLYAVLSQEVKTQHIFDVATVIASSIRICRRNHVKQTSAVLLFGSNPPARNPESDLLFGSGIWLTTAKQ